MNGHDAIAPGQQPKQFSVRQYRVLKTAARILGVGVGVTALSELLPKILDEYSLQDFEKLDAAADILGVSIGSEPEIAAASRHTPPKEPQPQIQQLLPTNDFDVQHAAPSNSLSPSSLGKGSGTSQALSLPANSPDHTLDSSLASKTALPSLPEQVSFGSM